MYVSEKAVRYLKNYLCFLSLLYIIVIILIIVIAFISNVAMERASDVETYEEWDSIWSKAESITEPLTMLVGLIQIIAMSMTFVLTGVILNIKRLKMKPES